MNSDCRVKHALAFSAAAFLLLHFFPLSDVLIVTAFISLEIIHCVL